MTKANFPTELTLGYLSYPERWGNKDHNNMCVCVKEFNTHLKSGQQETNMSLGDGNAQINKHKLIIVDINTTSAMQIPLNPDLWRFHPACYYTKLCLTMQYIIP